MRALLAVPAGGEQRWRIVRPLRGRREWVRRCKSSPERGGGSRRLTEGSIRPPPAPPPLRFAAWSPFPFRGGFSAALPPWLSRRVGCFRARPAVEVDRHGSARR